MKAIGQQLREAREKAGMTQLQLSQKIGYESMQFVSLYERGLSKVPMSTLGKVFEVLKFPVKTRRAIVRQIVCDFEKQITDEIVQGERAVM